MIVRLRIAYRTQFSEKALQETNKVGGKSANTASQNVPHGNWEM